MAISLHPASFLAESQKGVVLDVRSPAEYDKGHSPDALSFPLFTNEERASVGTLYKQNGKYEAVTKGLEIVGPKLKSFVEQAAALSNGKPLYLYCWRGGMRSSSMAFLLEAAGLSCFLLKGGYKMYRQHLLSEFCKTYHFRVIGGKTGSGKTEVLQHLKRLGEQVIDLESLACHKGSAFGRLGEKPQPSTEQFGNDLYKALSHLNPNKTIWLEDESHSIGAVFIPSEFYNNYRLAPLYVIEIPFLARLNHLVQVYGAYPKADLVDAFEKIRKKIGGLNLNLAKESIETGQLETAATIALNYYDETYAYGLKNKNTDKISYLNFDNLNPDEIAKALITTDGRNKVNPI